MAAIILEVMIEMERRKHLDFKIEFQVALLMTTSMTSVTAFNNAT